MKRTNIVLDEKLVNKGKKLTGIKTSKDLVNFALQQLVRRENQKKILELEGNIEWIGNLNKMVDGWVDIFDRGKIRFKEIRNNCRSRLHHIGGGVSGKLFFNGALLGVIFDYFIMVFIDEISDK